MKLFKLQLQILVKMKTERVQFSELKNLFLKIIFCAN